MTTTDHTWLANYKCRLNIINWRDVEFACVVNKQYMLTHETIQAKTNIIFNRIKFLNCPAKPVRIIQN